MIRALLRPIFDVKKEELPKVLLLFLNFYLIIASYYIVKSIRGALVIQELGADMLPYIWAATVVVLAVFVAFYGKVIDRFSRQWAMTLTIAFFIINLLGIRYLLTMKIPMMTAVFYVWGDIFSVVMVEQFWSFSNDLFTTKDAKRLYGLIGSGGILGGATGSKVVNMVVPYVGTANMIFVCIGVLGLLIGSVFALQWMVDRRKQVGHGMAGQQIMREKSTMSDSSRKSEGSDILKGFKLVTGSRYLALIALALILTQVVSTFIDFQFNKAIETTYTGRDQISMFFGNFYFYMNIISMAVMLLVTTPTLRYLGLLAGLLMLPMVNLFGATLFLAVPLPMVIFALKMADKSLNYSINRASKEILYIPTTKEVKYKAKAAIDMFGYRASKVVGSLLIVPITAVLGLSELNIFTIVLILGLVAVIFMMIREYSVAHRGKLANSLGEVAVQSAYRALDDHSIDAIVGRYRSAHEIKEAIFQFANSNEENPEFRRKVVYRLLAQLYPKEDVYLTYSAFMSPSREESPDEFLQTIFRGKDRKDFIPLLHRI